MKIWIDDVRPAPTEGNWVATRTVDEAKEIIRFVEDVCHSLGYSSTIELIDLDHDAGDFAQYGGDYIRILDWLEETGRNYPIRIHSMNPVGAANMRRIIERNGWKEIH